MNTKEFCIINPFNWCIIDLNINTIHNFISLGKYDVMCFQNIQGQFITWKPILEIVKFIIQRIT